MRDEKKLQFDDNNPQVPVAENCVAIIVIYSPPESLKLLIELVFQQLEMVVLVDNGENHTLCYLLGATFPRLHIMRNEANGLAKAQNMGIGWAKENGAKWVLLLDDDSLPAPDMVQQFGQYYACLPKEKQQKVGLLAPYLQEDALGKAPHYILPKGRVAFQRRSFTAEENALEGVYYACASGSLIPITLIERIGAMEEAFFLYFIDTEYGLRICDAGYQIHIVKAAVLQHRIGERSNHQLFGRVVSTTNHSALARYWMAKNRATLWWRYSLRQPGYVIFDMVRFASEIIRILCFESYKLAKITAMMRGLAQRTPPTSS